MQFNLSSKNKLARTKNICEGSYLEKFIQMKKKNLSLVYVYSEFHAF